MSGGYFGYGQFHIKDIAATIDELIAGNDDESLDCYGDRIGRGYSKETIERFREAAHNLRRAAEMAQRVDWLVSGDDGPDRFHSRWEEEVRQEYVAVTPEDAV